MKEKTRSKAPEMIGKVFGSLSVVANVSEIGSKDKKY